MLNQNQLRRQLSSASADINDTNHSLDLLKKVQDEIRKAKSIQFEGKNFSSEPQLNDFYKPSVEMKQYQLLFIGGVGIGAGCIVHKLAKYKTHYYFSSCIILA